MLLSVEHLGKGASHTNTTNQMEFVRRNGTNWLQLSDETYMFGQLSKENVHVCSILSGKRNNLVRYYQQGKGTIWLDTTNREKGQIG